MIWIVIASVYCTICTALAYAWMRSARDWARIARLWNVNFDQAVDEWKTAHRSDT